MSFKSQYATFY